MRAREAVRAINLLYACIATLAFVVCAWDPAYNIRYISRSKQSVLASNAAMSHCFMLRNAEYNPGGLQDCRRKFGQYSPRTGNTY